MEWLTNAVAWLKLNWTDIIAIWTSVIGVAEIIVKWLDSKKGTAILGKVRAAGVWLISILTKFGFEKPKVK